VASQKFALSGFQPNLVTLTRIKDFSLHRWEVEMDSTLSFLPISPRNQLVPEFDA